MDVTVFFHRGNDRISGVRCPTGLMNQCKYKEIIILDFSNLKKFLSCHVVNKRAQKRKEKRTTLEK